MIGLVFAEGLAGVVLIEGQVRIRIRRLHLAPIHTNTRVSVTSSDSDGLDIGHRLFGGLDEPIIELTIIIGLEFAIRRRSRMVVSVTQKNVLHRYAGRLRDFPPKNIGPLNDDDVGLEKSDADAGCLDNQGSGVQAILPVDPVGWGAAQVIPTHHHRSCGSNVGFRVTRTQILSPPRYYDT